MPSRKSAAEAKTARIAYAVTAMHPGGAERILLALAERLAGDGREFHLISLGKETDALMPEARRVFASVTLLPSKFRWDPAVLGRMRGALEDGGFALVHSHLPRASVYARLAARRLGLPEVYTEQSVWGYYRRPTRALNALTMPLCSRVVAVSERVAADVRSRMPESRVRIVRNAVPSPSAIAPQDRAEARRLLGVGQDGPLLINVGALRSAKAQDILIRAFADVRARIPSSRLAIIGQDQGRGPALRRLADDLGLADSVTFLGHRSDVTTKLLAGGDAFVLSSTHEGMPLSLLEAMLAGLPVVCTAVGGIPEVVEDGVSGRLVRPGSVTDLAHALLQVLDDGELAARLGRAARTVAAESFGEERMVAAYSELYEDFGC